MEVKLGDVARDVARLGVVGLAAGVPVPLEDVILPFAVVGGVGAAVVGAAEAEDVG